MDFEGDPEVDNSALFFLRSTHYNLLLALKLTFLQCSNFDMYVCGQPAAAFPQPLRRPFQAGFSPRPGGARAALGG